MIAINEYIKPKNIEEAYEILKSTSNSQIIGGGIFLRLTSKKIDKAIDPYDLGMNYIVEDADNVEIGAMTTFRDIETSEILKKNFGKVLCDSVKDVVGVQFRNAATIGGSIYPKYGFSDPLTALLALDCKVVLYKAGQIDLEEFLNSKIQERDILTKITIKKQDIKSSFKCLRNSAGDYSILNLAASRGYDGFKIVVGARPCFAKRAVGAEKLLNESRDIDEDIAAKAGEIASEEIAFASNYLATANYRQKLCTVMVKRAIMEVVE